MPNTQTHPRWMSTVLKLAGIYNVAWGLLTVVFPGWLFALTGLEPPAYMFLWQCVGMIVGVYGIGYWIAASDPDRHWPIVLVGLTGKILGPAGYLLGVGLADLPLPGVTPVPPEFGVALITNDLVWWIPFAAILWNAAKNKHAPPEDAVDLTTALERARTNQGAPLIDRTRAAPVLLVFLRHAGCTFCKETVADLAAAGPRLDDAGVTPIVVHMSSDDSISHILASHGLNHIERVSDPDRALYRAFELGRGSFTQLFGLGVWFRGLAATLRGHMIGKPDGDGFQMPGAFLLHDAKIVHASRHRTAADRPDYAGMARRTDDRSVCAAPATRVSSRSVSDGNTKRLARAPRSERPEP